MAADWHLVPALASLRAEFNQVAPGFRDTRSDGTIGDRAHADRPSDHNPDETGETPYEDADSKNEVHALDVDHTGPWLPGQSMALYAEEIVRRHRHGLDDRLQNVIYAGRIASRSWGWTWREYTGSNGHYEHAHFSCRYDSGSEGNTKPWGLTARFIIKPEADVALKDDLIKITADTGEVINKAPGTEVSAASLIQHAVIRAGRAARDAGAALDLAEANHALLKQLLELAGQDTTGTASDKPANAPKPAAPAAAKPTGSAKPAAGK
jgi:hypothetical protein